MHYTVKDPDLQIRRGAGGSHPDPEIRGGAVSKKNFFPPFGPLFGLKLMGRPGSPGSLPWIRQCYSRSLYLTLKKLSGRTIIPLPLGLPHLGNCVENMFANPYPIVETVYLLKVPHVLIKSRRRAVSLLASFARKLWRSAICLCERSASCAGTSSGGQILTYHISSKRETARSPPFES